MDVATPVMTLDQFIAGEERQEARFEFNGREPEEMVGGTDRHAALAVAVAALLPGQLRGTAFRAFNGDLKVQTTGRIRYPDVFVAGSALDGSTARSRRDLRGAVRRT